MRFPSSTGRRTLTGAPFFFAFAAFATIAVLVLVAPSEVTAHDFWIEPSDLRPAVGERLSLDLRVGHGGDADSVARNPERQVRFVARAPDGETRNVQGVAGHTPAGSSTPARSRACWMSVIAVTAVTAATAPP